MTVYKVSKTLRDRENKLILHVGNAYVSAEAFRIWNENSTFDVFKTTVKFFSLLQNSSSPFPYFLHRNNFQNIRFLRIQNRPFEKCYFIKFQQTWINRLIYVLWPKYLIRNEMMTGNLASKNDYIARKIQIVVFVRFPLPLHKNSEIYNIRTEFLGWRQISPANANETAIFSCRVFNRVAYIFNAIEYVHFLCKTFIFFPLILFILFGRCRASLM